MTDTTPERLEPTLVEDALTALPAWSGDASALTRTVVVEGPAADELMSSVNELSEALDHQPRVERQGSNLTFVLATHEAGGVTAVDLAMASRIEDLVSQATGVPAAHVHHEPLAEAEEE